MFIVTAGFQKVDKFLNFQCKSRLLCLFHLWFKPQCMLAIDGGIQAGDMTVDRLGRRCKWSHWSTCIFCSSKIIILKLGCAEKQKCSILVTGVRKGILPGLVIAEWGSDPCFHQLQNSCTLLEHHGCQTLGGQNGKYVETSNCSKTEVLLCQ